MKTANLRTFYTLILTQTLSLIGSRISGLAIGIWVFQQTGNATPFALVSFFSVIPLVLASGVAGALADRWNRRYMMALADAGQALGTLLLLVSFTSGAFALWHLYVVTLIQAIFATFQSPAFSASITLLVPEDQRDRANAIQQLSGPLAGVIAPILAGAIFAWIGVSGAILIDMLTFLVALVVVLSITIPQPKQTAEGRATRGGLLRESLGGLRFLLSRRVLFGLMLFVSLVNFMFSGVGTLATPYLLARTGDAATVGLLLGVMNLGAIAGGITMSVWGGTRPRIHTIMPGLLVSCAFMIVVGMGQNPLVLGAAMLAFIFPMPMINASFMSMLQAKVPPDLQGRVFAVVGQLSMLLTPIAYLLVGPLADTVFEPAAQGPNWQFFAPIVGSGLGAGIGLMFVISGAFIGIGALMIYGLPAIRAMEANLPDYVAEAAEPEAQPISPEASPA